MTDRTAEDAAGEKVRVAARVTGRVQGVGFRHFTRQTARRLGVHGWVRNEPDGSVRLEVEGDPAAVAQLVEAAREGPGTARVEQVTTEDRAVMNDSTPFSVRYHK